jgi:spoIIIJ-associated protein
MRSIETEGDDIDQAIANALRALQVDRDRVEIEILSAATRSVFGFGGKKASIRATVRAPLVTAADVPHDEPSVSRGTEGAVEAGATHLRRTADGSDATARAVAFLETLLERIGTGYRVEARDDDCGSVLLTVSGAETGLVIGRRGQTLDAIEYLVNRSVARDGDPAGIPRFLVDAENYRSRRREYLDNLAARLCAKVAKTGRPVTLNPMTPRDRRIVHLAVQQHGGMVSRSEGEGHLRAMVIAPEGGSARPRRPR